MKHCMHFASPELFIWLTFCQRCPFFYIKAMDDVFNGHVSNGVLYFGLIFSWVILNYVGVSQSHVAILNTMLLLSIGEINKNFFRLSSFLF